MRAIRRQLSKKASRKLVNLGKIACRLFTERGYFETSLEDISAEAGISKGALYYYFPSKTEILYFVLSNFGDRILEDLEKDLEQIQDSRDKIRYVISRHVDLYVRFKDEGKALMSAKHSLPAEYLNAIRGTEKEYFRIVSDVLSGLLGDKVEKDEITCLTFNLFGMCNSIYMWYSPKGSISPKKLSEIICSTFINGCLSRKMPEIQGIRRNRKDKGNAQFRGGQRL